MSTIINITFKNEHSLCYEKQRSTEANMDEGKQDTMVQTVNSKNIGKTKKTRANR